MARSFLLGTADPGLSEAMSAALTDAFANLPNIMVVADSCEALRRLRAVRDPDPGTVLVLDAWLPEMTKARLDRQARAAADLLAWLSGRMPVLVVTSQVGAVPKIDDFCAPENRAIAMPSQCLDDPDIVAGFVRMLDPAEPFTWNVIEIDVQKDCAVVYLGTSAGKIYRWGEVPQFSFLGMHTMAQRFANYVFQPKWSEEFHQNGRQLFTGIVMRSLGLGLFAHLERAAGGLEGLAFRFRVDDPTLHTAPFEATVRLSPTGDERFDVSPFVVVHAPIARRMRTVALRTRQAGKLVPSRPKALLFIRSQVGENPTRATVSDLVQVPCIEEETGRVVARFFEFGRLGNIDSEAAELEALCRVNNVAFTLLDLTGERSPAGAQHVVRERLEAGEYDVVHFAGHSITHDTRTLLIVPGETAGDAEGIPIDRFADWVASAGARLLYLSSCQGSSARTVASLAQRGVPHVLGFRWNVEDKQAAYFAHVFYSQLFGRRVTICRAFREACSGAYNPVLVEETPIWASAILASQSDDWSSHAFWP
jgi:CheY-like chemotaxis protein